MPPPSFCHKSRIQVSFVMSWFACLVLSPLLIDSEPGRVALRGTPASPLPETPSLSPVFARGSFRECK